MDSSDLNKILQEVASGAMPSQQALELIRNLPFLQVGDITWDTHRLLRRGIAESIYGPGKTVRQVADALDAAARSDSNCVVTRITRDFATDVIADMASRHPGICLTWHETARMISLQMKAPKPTGIGTVVVMTAGTSDIPVAEEAAVALEIMGDRVVRVRDVGVAGIHRLVPHLDDIRGASVIIVVAGMEGALPGVVAGITPAPVIGVPTSVGYGTSFGGITALLAMLNSCAGGLTVVNIDNGFGAAVAAHLINTDRTAQQHERQVGTQGPADRDDK